MNILETIAGEGFMATSHRHFIPVCGSNIDAVLGSWDTFSKIKHLQFNKFFFNLLKKNSYYVIPLIPSLGYILGYISVFVVFGSERKVDMPKLIQQDSWAVRWAK